MREELSAEQSRIDHLSDLHTLAAELGPRGLQVLVAVAERLRKGAREHGDFAHWPQAKPETLEEMLDAVVYLVVGLLPEANK
jgi:hypothetical protein